MSIEPYRRLILPKSPQVDAGTSGLVLRKGAPVTRHITVLTSTGQAIPEAVIWGWQRDGIRGPDADYEGIHVETNEDGEAVVEGLEAGGTYDLRVEPPYGNELLRPYEQEGWTPQDEIVRLQAAQ